MREDSLAGFADALIARVAALHPGMTLLPGTASASTVADDGRDVLTVTMDNNVDVSIPAASLIGPTRAGDRVMVAFVPPQGAFVLAWATLPARFRAHTVNVATTWTVAGVPVVAAATWSYLGPYRVAADIQVGPLTGVPAGGALAVTVPVAAATAGQPVGPARIYGGNTFSQYNCACRLLVGGTQIQVEDVAGNALASGNLTTGSSIQITAAYRPA